MLLIMMFTIVNKLSRSVLKDLLSLHCPVPYQLIKALKHTPRNLSTVQFLIN